ncbi:MAG: CDP-diacylglycerol--serine O-phosphatidyltransferase [Rhizomicrobium sp.]|jgi:CDP-diacylglycerol--serine O-phosphatidyltransferase
MAHEKQTPKQWASEQRDRLEDTPISKIIPSALTLLGLCSGATAIRFALVQDWKWAVAAIFCAMLFDMLDGRAARWLGSDSSFGTQLDSLADLVSFGVGPAIVVYTWTLSQIDGAGWIAALIFCACSAIRLARFNVESARDEGATVSHPYFIGLPMPAAAGVMLLPLLLSFEFGNGFVRQPILCVLLIAITSVLMVSRVPTPSLKYIRFGRDGWIAVAIVVTALATLAIYAPWATLAIGILIYLATIPIVVLRSLAKHDAVEQSDSVPVFSKDSHD